MRPLCWPARCRRFAVAPVTVTHSSLWYDRCRPGYTFAPDTVALAVARPRCIWLDRRLQDSALPWMHVNWPPAFSFCRLWLRPCDFFFTIIQNGLFSLEMVFSRNCHRWDFNWNYIWNLSRSARERERGELRALGIWVVRKAMESSFTRTRSFAIKIL